MSNYALSQCINKYNQTYINTIYYRNGNVKSETDMLNLEQKTSKYYHRNGQISFICSYKNNKRNGICLNYDENGNNIYIGIWHNGVCNYFAGDNRNIK